MKRIDRTGRGRLRAAVLAGLLIVTGGVVGEDSEVFEISYESEVMPLPLNRIHSWRLRVETVDGEPVRGAVIEVDGGMPAHNHGLPTQPVVRELGNGDYLVEGVKFSMTGHWEMWFEVKAGGRSEKQRFTVDL